MNDDQLVNVLKESVQIVPGTCVFIVDRRGVIREIAQGDEFVADLFNLRKGMPVLFMDCFAQTNRTGQSNIDGVPFAYEKWISEGNEFEGAVCALGGERGTLEKLPHLVALTAMVLRNDKPLAARKLAHDVGNYVSTIDMAMQVLIAQKAFDDKMSAKAQLIREASRKIVSLIAQFAVERGNQSVD